jgi:hypothetical protein
MTQKKDYVKISESWKDRKQREDNKYPAKLVKQTLPNPAKALRQNENYRPTTPQGDMAGNKTILAE